MRHVTPSMPLYPVTIILSSWYDKGTRDLKPATGGHVLRLHGQPYQQNMAIDQETQNPTEFATTSAHKT
jgi:hypothetical protein